MTPLIETRVDEAAGWILLNNTRHKNAINYEMYDAMFDALDRFEADERVRAVVVSGNGGHFSAGFDVTQGSPEPYRDFVKNVSGRLSKRLCIPIAVLGIPRHGLPTDCHQLRGR